MSAIVISPNLVAARFIQLTPAYDGGPELADGAVLDLDHTGVPVEWDQVKEELTKLSAQLGPGPGGLSPLRAGIIFRDGFGKRKLRPSSLPEVIGYNTQLSLIPR